MKKNIILFYFILLSSIAFSQSDSYANKNRAYIASQEFVKIHLNYPKEVNFYGGVVHEITANGKCVVLGKYSAKNAFGVKSEYVYKIWMSHNGGDWTDQNTWKYGKLILEDTATGEKFVFNGGRKELSNKGTKGLGEIDGVNCTIIESTSSAIRIKTTKRLSKEQIKRSIKKFNISVNTVMFTLPGKEKRGDEYASYVGGSVFIFK